MEASNKRSASLTFRGFNMSPQEVASLVGTEAVLLAQAGLPIKLGRATVWPRSAAKFQMAFEDDVLVADMIPAILAHLGGVQHLCRVRDRVSPEFFEIDLKLTCDNSEAHKNGYLDLESLRNLAHLEATLGLSFD